MRWWLLLVCLLAVPATAQNQIGDECIIRITLEDDLKTVTIAYDLLFDELAWANLTAAIDGDADGFLTGPEIQAFELAVHQVDVAVEDLPEARLVNLDAAFSHNGYSGVQGAVVRTASNATELINFEGPVGERTGKTVRETWTYHFDDPLVQYEATLRARAASIVISWGPEADPNPSSSVSVVETVVVAAPADWWIAVDGERHREITFASGDGYQITFIPNTPPSEPFWPIPGLGFGGVLLALALRMRRSGA